MRKTGGGPGRVGEVPEVPGVVDLRPGLGGLVRAYILFILETSGEGMLLLGWVPRR